MFGQDWSNGILTIRPGKPMRPGAAKGHSKRASSRKTGGWGRLGRAQSDSPRAIEKPRTRRRHLIRMGINPDRVHMASRSRKGYWRMSGNSLVQVALNNQWLKEQGVPELRDIWIKLHYGDGAASVSKV